MVPEIDYITVDASINLSLLFRWSWGRDEKANTVEMASLDVEMKWEWVVWAEKGN